MVVSSFSEVEISMAKGGQVDLDGHGEVSRSLGLVLSRCRECQKQQGFGYSLGKKNHCLGEEPQ